MSESRFRCAILLINKAKPVEGKGMRPDALIAHEGQLWYGQPIACRDVIAIRRGIWNHDRAGGAYCIERLCVSIILHQNPLLDLLSLVEERMAYRSDPDSGEQSLS